MTDMKVSALVITLKLVLAVSAIDVTCPDYKYNVQCFSVVIYL